MRAAHYIRWVVAMAALCAGCKRDARPAEAPPVAGLAGDPSSVASESLVPNVDPQPALERTPGAPRSPTSRPPPLDVGERFEPYAVVPLPLRGFERLSLGEKITAFHLYQASAAGRDIAFDQLSPLGLPLRRALDQIVVRAPGLDPELHSRIRNYAALVWIGNGPHDPLTRRLWTVGFSKDEWNKAVASSELTGLDPRIETLLFDPERDSASSNEIFGPNFRSGLSFDQIQEFDDRYGPNSRLVISMDTPTEQVYRAGRDPAPGVRPAPKGRMAETLGRVITHLRAAEATATAGQQRMLRPLIDYLHSGAASDYEAYAVAWLADRPRVDLVMGFIEADRDPHGIKGVWEGLLTLVDAPSVALMRAIADQVPGFEERAPWADDYRRTYEQTITTPTPRQVIVAHGDAGPALALGRSLPNIDAVRSEHGARRMIFTNVIRSLEVSMGGPMIDEFAAPADRADAHRLAPLIRDVRTALVEVYAGHCAKRIDALIGTDDAMRLREWTTPLERLRIDLVVLHTFFDSGLHDVVDGCGQACAETAVRTYLRETLANLRFSTGPDVRDHHHRAGQLIAVHAIKRGAAAMTTVDGKRYLTVSDMTDMRALISELLAEVTRIRGVGDYAAARALFEDAMMVDPALRNEVSLRARRLQLPRSFAWLMPELKPVRDAAGAITDVIVAWPRDFETSMIGLGGAVR